MKPSKATMRAAQREPAEVTYREELDRLISLDPGPVPPGWQMSPRGVEKFLLGDEKLGIERKFVADRAMVVRIIISLCTSRGCLLVGEPGTAKSWLSELLAAAISGTSTLTLQGGRSARSASSCTAGMKPSCTPRARPESSGADPLASRHDGRATGPF